MGKLNKFLQLIRDWRFRQRKEPIFQPAEHHVMQNDAEICIGLQDQAHYHEMITKDYIRQIWNTLTFRERKVTELLHKGYSNNEIAQELKISNATVKTHVHNVLKKFNIRSRRILMDVLVVWEFNDVK